MFGGDQPTAFPALNGSRRAPQRRRHRAGAAEHIDDLRSARHVSSYDIVVRFATTFSYGAVSRAADNGQMAKSTAGSKLKALRKRSGLSVQDLADLLGIPKSTYGSKEDKGKAKYLPFEFVEQIKPHLLARNIPLLEIDALAGVSTTTLGQDPLVEEARALIFTLARDELEQVVSLMRMFNAQKSRLRA